MGKKPLILITNDDGIHAPGIIALERELRSVADCFVVAPIRQCSSVGQAVTLRENIEVTPFEDVEKVPAYGIHGTPVDCVKFALCELMKSQPDLVVSGINQGSNTGVSVYYSGTVAGAREALICGIPSVAFSLASNSSIKFKSAAIIAKQVVVDCLKNKLPRDTFLNVNIPDLPKSKIKGVRVVPQADSRFVEVFKKQKSANGVLRYKLTGEMIINDNSIETDEGVIKKGYVSVTPLQLDSTHYDCLKEVAKRFEGKKMLKPQQKKRGNLKGVGK